jgi:hypothetical protein
MYLWGETVSVDMPHVASALASYITGLQSYAFSSFEGTLLASLYCGSGPTQSCQAPAMQNPFRGFSPLRNSAPSLFSADRVLLTDGGLQQELPAWPFLTSARQADIIFAVDSSADNKAGPVSSDTAEPASSRRRGPRVRCGAVAQRSHCSSRSRGI